MKKILVVLSAAALFASCAKTDKCTCTVELKSENGKVTAKEVTMPRPEDGKCSDIKVSDIKGDFIHINLSNVAKIKCKPLYE